MKEPMSMQEINTKRLQLFTQEIDYDALVVKLLLLAGIDTEIRDKRDKTVLHHVAEWCRVPLLEQLLENGADVYVTNEDGKTPLEIAFATDFLTQKKERSR